VKIPQRDAGIATVGCSHAYTTTESRWLQRSIVVGAGLFIFALFLSAVFEPSIRILLNRG